MLSVPELIDFETAHPQDDWSKGERIRDELGVTPVRYYVLLERAIRTMEAVRHDPIATGQIRERFNPKPRRMRCGFGVPPTGTVSYEVTEEDFD